MVKKLMMLRCMVCAAPVQSAQANVYTEGAAPYNANHSEYVQHAHVGRGLNDKFLSDDDGVSVSKSTSLLEIQAVVSPETAAKDTDNQNNEPKRSPTPTSSSRRESKSTSNKIHVTPVNSMEAVSQAKQMSIVDDLIVEDISHVSDSKADTELDVRPAEVTVLRGPVLIEADSDEKGNKDVNKYETAGFEDAVSGTGTTRFTTVHKAGIHPIETSDNTTRNTKFSKKSFKKCKVAPKPQRTLLHDIPDSERAPGILSASARSDDDDDDSQAVDASPDLLHPDATSLNASNDNSVQDSNLNIAAFVSNPVEQDRRTSRFSVDGRGVTPVNSMVEPVSTRNKSRVGSANDRILRSIKCFSGAAKTYLVNSSKMDSTKRARTNNLEAIFPMHCMKIQDLLELEKLPNHQEVARMGKFVIANNEEKRSLLKGRTVRPNPFWASQPGMPTKRKFNEMLKDCLIWVDYFGIPQATTAKKSSDKENENQHGSSDDRKTTDNESSTSNDNTAANMVAAIESLPAYVKRSSEFFVLAPVVHHKNLDEVDCDFSSWQQRGWCRVEAVVRALESNETHMTVIHSEQRIQLLPASDLLYRTSVGTGDFACCTLNHKIQTAEGVYQSIPCDRDKLAPLMHTFYQRNIQKTQREAQQTKGRDLSQHRLLLAHKHIILKKLACLEQEPKLDSWNDFADAFNLDVKQPLQKCSGVFPWSPLLWAVLSNNDKVVKHLIQCGANVNEQVSVRKGGFCYYDYGAPLHLIMAVGHGDAGKAIFDSLIVAGADPHILCRKTKYRRIPYISPMTAGAGFLNQEMCLHHCQQVTPHFTAYSSPYGTPVENTIVNAGMYDTTVEFIKMGANYSLRDWHGNDVLGAFILTPKEFHLSADVRILDLLVEHNKVDEDVINGKPSSGWMVALTLVAMRLRILKKKGFVRLMDDLRGATYLHAAVILDKPQVLVWLLEHGVDKNQKSKNGKTALDLAIAKKHHRCQAILKGDQKAITKYSSRRPSVDESPAPQTSPSQEANDVQNSE